MPTNTKPSGTIGDTQKTMTISATSFRRCNRFSPLLIWCCWLTGACWISSHFGTLIWISINQPVRWGYASAIFVLTPPQVSQDVPFSQRLCGVRERFSWNLREVVMVKFHYVMISSHQTSLLERQQFHRFDVKNLFQAVRCWISRWSAWNDSSQRPKHDQTWSDANETIETDSGLKHQTRIARQISWKWTGFQLLQVWDTVVWNNDPIHVALYFIEPSPQVNKVNPL